MLFATLTAKGQITIGGNVYGGGNEGRVAGSTAVTVYGGNMSGCVFGGARSADVGGSTFVHIDGAKASTDIYIKEVYGGNDADGTIGTGTYLPHALTDTTANNIDNTWNAFVRTSEVTEGRQLHIDRLFGGGNHANLGKAYAELCGGIIDDVYGGGNEATVTAQTDIFINNATPVAMGNYQFTHVFGGNNKAVMNIRPVWHLTRGIIHDLYSGGNEGDMTATEGIELNVDSSDVTVINVYGGCRKANVRPGTGVEYGATVNIRGGKITNVYGGNDISGTIYLGTRVNIMSNIIGDVYGGGNGSYVYTDNVNLANDETYGDYYYDKGAKTSVEALLDHRPNVENTLVYLAGTEQHPTYIGGAVYCGGNSATLRTAEGSLTGARAALRIGSYVIADKVFMGSNGANMVSSDILQYYAGTYHDETINTMSLTNADEFSRYMQGVEVAIRPSVSFDNNYVPYSTRIGSFYCGGNVGSMSAAGIFTIDFLNSLVIYNKLVGGCNHANIDASEYNAAHRGGLTAEAHPKVQMNLSGLKLEPKKLTYDEDGNPVLEWNTTSEGDDKRLHGANIYGGCYESGYVNGDIEINLLATTVERDEVFGDGGSGVVLDEQGDDVFGDAMNVFGGGYGTNSVIQGNTTLNVESGYTFQVFGGGERGVVTGNCNVNLNGGEVEYLYGGGFVGPIEGNVTVKTPDNERLTKLTLSVGLSCRNYNIISSFDSIFKPSQSTIATILPL